MYSRRSDAVVNAMVDHLEAKLMKTADIVLILIKLTFLR